MKKSFFLFAALAISQIGNAQEKQTSDFLEDMCDCHALHPVDFKIGPYEPTSSCAVETWEYHLGVHSLRIGVTSVSLTEKDNVVFKENPFDLQGRSAPETQKGIFVRDGKTVLVK